MTTLTELLSGMSLTSIIFVGASAGLEAILNANARAEVQSRAHSNIQRTLDFMGDEVRSASSINRSANMQNQGTAAQAVQNAGLTTVLGGGTPVLYLEQNYTCYNQPFVERIIYFRKPSTNPWRKPNTLYRYGRVPTIGGGINCLQSAVSSAVVDEVQSLTATASGGLVELAIASPHLPIKSSVVSSRVYQ